jgi:Brp/Blh family beta-carotene 15,15'-monooxygenase
LFIAFGILLTYYIFYSKNRQSLIVLIEEVAYIILFYILFSNSTLLWSFAIYFIVWHALPSLNDQIINIYGQTNLPNVVKYLRVSFLYWGLSVIGICLLSYYTADNTALFNLLFVALLASITFPHAIVIFKMQR